MKIGNEVEGAFRGIKTLFCQASELPAFLARKDALINQYGLHHLYVSDWFKLLTQLQYDQLSAIGMPVTIEVTAIPSRARLSNIRYMVAVEVDPVELGFFSNHSRHLDQIKFTTNQHVATARMSDFNTTIPADFMSDVEIEV